MNNKTRFALIDAIQSGIERAIAHGLTKPADLALFAVTDAFGTSRQPGPFRAARNSSAVAEPELPAHITPAARLTAEAYGTEVRQHLTQMKRFNTQGKGYETKRHAHRAYLAARRAGRYALELLESDTPVQDDGPYRTERDAFVAGRNAAQDWCLTNEVDWTMGWTKEGEEA